MTTKFHGQGWWCRGGSVWGGMTDMECLHGVVEVDHTKTHTLTEALEVWT